MKQDTTSSASASVDELSLAVKTLKLDPVPLMSGSAGGGVKKSGSSQSLNSKFILYCDYIHIVSQN